MNERIRLCFGDAYGLHYESKIGAYTRCVFVLPVIREVEENGKQLVLVDDELSSRNTIKKYLEENDIYEIIADFKNGKTALDWLRKNSVDILLCDMQMPEMNGVELMRNVHIINEYLPVIAISGFDDFNFVRGSLVNGAANYLLKHELTKEYLLHVLDQVREQYRIVPKGKKVYRKRGFCIREEISFQADYIRKLTEENKIEF